MKKEETQERILSVQEWHALALEDITLPVTILVNGDSMRPFIRRQRDKVTVIPLRGRPKKGQIILFPSRCQKGSYVIHRVWKTERSRIRTLGDACLNPDGWMEPEAAWGVVTRIERDGRIIRPGQFRWYLWGRIWMSLHPLRRCLFQVKCLAVKRCRSG